MLKIIPELGDLVENPYLAQLKPMAIKRVFIPFALRNYQLDYPKRSHKF